jgi:hypothetical protein
MEVFVLLKGYDFEGFGSNVEVFSTREGLLRERLYLIYSNSIVASSP